MTSGNFRKQNLFLSKTQKFLSKHVDLELKKMSRLEKLQIQGFRSFSPDETKKQRIVFTRRDEFSGKDVSSPLTLILGQNGCGKTTIIE